MRSTPPPVSISSSKPCAAPFATVRFTWATRISSACPLAQLSSTDYAAGQRSSIRADKAMPSSLLPGIESEPGGTQTTHFSAMDANGNLVAATISINLFFGNGYVPAKTGVLLNNTMDDFSTKPGQPNAFGLVGAKANAIAPNKRSLSSMSPTFVETPKGR